MRKTQIISTLPNESLKFEDLAVGEAYKVQWYDGKLGQAVYLKTSEGSFRVAASRAQPAGSKVADGDHMGREVARVALTGEFEDR